MMQVRCQRCSWVFTMSRDSIGIAVAEAEQSHVEYYQALCPKCRHVIKIQVKELRRRLPADYILPTLPPKPEPIHVKKDGEKGRAAPAAGPAQPAAPLPAAQSETAPMPGAETIRGKSPAESTSEPATKRPARRK